MIEVKENEPFAPVLDALRQVALIIFEHPDKAGQQMASFQREWTNVRAGGLRAENLSGHMGLPGMVIDLEPEVIRMLQAAEQLVMVGEPPMGTKLVVKQPALFEVGGEQRCVLPMVAEPLDARVEVMPFSDGNGNFAMIDPRLVEREYQDRE